MSDRTLGWRRAGLGLAAYAALEVTLTVLDFAPDALRLALVVAVVVAALGLLRDALAGGGASWPSPPAPSVVPPGSDARLAAYVRLIEGMQTARTPDAALRDRLARLAGGRLDAELAGPPRRLSLAEIDDFLQRIEER